MSRAAITETFDEFRQAVHRGERTPARRQPMKGWGVDLLSLTAGWLRAEPRPAPLESALPLPHHQRCQLCPSIVLGSTPEELAQALQRHHRHGCRDPWAGRHSQRGPVPAAPGAQERLTPAPEGPGTG